MTYECEERGETISNRGILYGWWLYKGWVITCRPERVSDIFVYPYTSVVTPNAGLDGRRTWVDCSNTIGGVDDGGGGGGDGVVVVMMVRVT